MTRSVSSDSSSPAAVNRFRPVGPSTGDGGWSLPHRRGTLHGGRPGRTVGGGAHPAAGPVAAGTAATATAYGAVLAAALGLGALAVPGGPVRLVMLLAFVTFGPGAAVICHVRVTDRLVEWALAVTASLTATAAVATAMVWVHLWQPVAAQAAMASAVGVSGLVALINRRPRPEPARELVGNALLWYDTGAVDPRPAGTLTHGPRSDEAETRVIAVATTHTRQVLRAVGMARVGGSPAIEPAASKTGIAAFLGTGPVALLGVAVLLWVVSMLRYQPARLDGYGLTRAMGVLFVGAVVAVGLSFAIELIGRARTTVLAGGVLVVTVILNATVPLLYREPEYAWTYKHLGVIDLLRDHGAVVDHTDIYQQWPAFFALVAEVSATARVDALAFAAWSPLFFTLLDGLLLAALLKQVTSSRRVVLLGVFLFESCLWVCINYLSPQAFAFALALGFWVILTRWLIAMPVPSKVGNGRLRRRRTALFYGLPTPSALGGRRTPALAVVGAVAVFAVITASHQLSPFLIITPILLLTVFGAIRPRWLIIPLGLILAGYVLPRLGPLGEQYRLFDGFNPFKNGGGNAQSWGSAGQRFSALVVRVLSIVVWSVALFAIWRNRRRLGLVMVSVIIGFAPFVALAVASYGGEAIYRIFAFSLPWSALLIAGLWAGRRRTTLFGGVVTGVLLAAAALATVQGLHGQLVVDAVPASDVRAARYFYAHAPAGATLMLATDAFPTRLAANYGSYDVGHPANVALTNDPTLFEGRMFGPADLPSLQRHLRSVGGTASYLVISDPMIASSDYFGHYPTGSLPALDRALAASPSWKVFYADHGVRIYQLVSPAGP